MNDGFIKKGTLQLDNIKNYFKQETTVKDVQAALDFCERYAVENNKIISLGSGFNCDRRLGKNWKTIVRFLGGFVQVYSKRTGSVQGTTVQEYEERSEVEQGYHNVINMCKNENNSSDGFIIPKDQYPLWERYYKLRKICRKQTAWDREQFFINMCGNTFTEFTKNVKKAIGKEQPHAVTL